MLKFYKENLLLIDTYYHKSKENNYENSPKFSAVFYIKLFSNLIELIVNYDSYLGLGEHTASTLKILSKNLQRLWQNSKKIADNKILFEGIFDLERELTTQELKYLFETIALIERKAKENGINLSTGEIVETYISFPELPENHPIKKYVNSNKILIYLNRQRTRNVVFYENRSHQIIYDLKEKQTKLHAKIPISNFEYDKNRNFLDKVCRDFLYDFNNQSDYFLSLLNENKKLYKDQIDIIKGKKEVSTPELLALVSLLGRLHQQQLMGPITTYREEKLFPTYILKNLTALTYVRETIKTLEEYRQIFLIRANDFLMIPNINNGIDVYNNNSSEFSENGLLAEIRDPNMVLTIPPMISIYEKDGIFRPNYLLSFFKKLLSLPRFKSVLPFFNSNEDLSDLIVFSKRYRDNPNEQNFMISAKIRNLLMTKQPEDIINGVHEVYLTSRKGSYSLDVAAYLIDQNTNLLNELVRGFFIFEAHVEEEKEKYKFERSQPIISEYNNDYLSVSSDMHFNELNNFQKINYSSNFNVFAGDFADNLYHRGHNELVGLFEPQGVGVLGNHDIYLGKTPTITLKKEIKTNFKKSIKILKNKFPNVKILNDEVLYKDGYAIIGMNLIYDIKDNEKTFFANRLWGAHFDEDDYMQRAINLLDQVPSEVPIIFISHSPFKEYAVCTNKDLGVPTNKIFKNYPNVKIYIHGHGHSLPQKKMIDNILCITNPLIFHNMISKVSFSKEELARILSLS